MKIKQAKGTVDRWISYPGLQVPLASAHHSGVSIGFEALRINLISYYRSIGGNYIQLHEIKTNVCTFSSDTLCASLSERALLCLVL